MDVGRAVMGCKVPGKVLPLRSQQLPDGGLRLALPQGVGVLPLGS